MTEIDLINIRYMLVLKRLPHTKFATNVTIEKNNDIVFYLGTVKNKIIKFKFSLLYVSFLSSWRSTTAYRIKTRSIQHASH